LRDSGGSGLRSSLSTRQLHGGVGRELGGNLGSDLRFSRRDSFFGNLGSDLRFSAARSRTEGLTLMVRDPYGSQALENRETQESGLRRTQEGQAFYPLWAISQGFGDGGAKDDAEIVERASFIYASLLVQLRRISGQASPSTMSPVEEGRVEMDQGTFSGQERNCQ
jgi:hypothetical protein